jgi:hypothetical protein
MRPVDRYVREAQDSSGQYEQDLWPGPNQFPVRAGQVVAWSGESGAGGPHLHFEIRRGDFAYQPERAGLVLTRRGAPKLPRVTLEPLDDSSSVAGGMGPITIALGRADTVRAIGRLRAVVDARDGTWSGVDRMVPWQVGLSWRGKTTICRFDSVSWATDMVEGEYVHDSGRVVGGKGLVLWAPPGFRPRFLRSDEPLSEAAGTIDIHPGDPPRALDLWARDVAGKAVHRTVVLRAEAPPSPARAGWWNGQDPWTDLPGEITSLPGGSIRWSIPAGVAPGGADLQVGPWSRRATRVGNEWCAVFRPPYPGGPGRAAPVALASRLAALDGTSREVGGIVLGAWASPHDSLEIDDEGQRLRVPAHALFETGFVFAGRGAAPGQAVGLSPISRAWNVGPRTLPLRRPVSVRLAIPVGMPADRVGVCRLEGGVWDWIGADRDSLKGTVSAETRGLGAFALFRDTTPPRVALLSPPRRGARGPYSRWSVEASVVEQGSGVDGRASWLEVDGARVPTEWDPETRRLRWRPVHPPSPGPHEALIVATDRAGNTTREHGTFQAPRQ